MSSLPSDPAAAAAFSRLADELAALRGSVNSLNERLEALTNENTTLRTRLELSESARNDLVAQTEHILQLLADARRELRAINPS